MIIVRTLFDVDDGETRNYQIRELSFEERNLLDIVSSTAIHISNMSHEHHTDITYTII